MIFFGVLSIYYGDEVGLLGKFDFDCCCSFFIIEKWDCEVLEYYKQLIVIRKEYLVLCIGNYEVLFVEGNVYIFVCILEEEEIIVVVNIGIEVVKVNVIFNKFKF